MNATAPTISATPRQDSRPPLSALGRVSLIAQIVSAVLSLVGGIVLQVFVGHGVPLLVVAVLFAAGAALTRSRVRWGTIPGVLLGLGDVIMIFVAGNGYPVYHLQHPAELYPVFLGIVLGLALAVLTFGASLAATLQSYLGRDQERPRWLTPALSGLAGVVVGALLLGALAQPAPAATASSTINGVPAVHLGLGNFDQSAITIPVGSKLVLADDAGVVHIFAYGSWDQNKAHPESPAGAPALNNLRVNSGNVELGPFTAAGTYHIYCVIHPGMNLTVTVQ